MRERCSNARFFKKFNIRSFVDAPCGDSAWMQLVNLTGIDYTGLDISPQYIGGHQQKFGRPSYPGVRFGVFDLLLNNVPPAADAVMSRELWFHIRPEHALMALNNIRRSGAKYLITSTHPNVTENAAEPAALAGTGKGGDWGYYDVNVELPPEAG
jgi:hypothetical protein